MSETIQIRRQWCNIFKGLKETDGQPRILYPEKISFRNKGEVKILFKHRKAGRIYHHKMYSTRNVKESPLGKRKMILDGNVGLHKEMESAGNGEYVYKHKMPLSYFKNHLKRLLMF